MCTEYHGGDKNRTTSASSDLVYYMDQRQQQNPSPLPDYAKLVLYETLHHTCNIFKL